MSEFPALSRGDHYFNLEEEESPGASNASGGHTAHRALLRPGGDYVNPGWGRLGLRGESGRCKPMADKYRDPYKVLERGNKAWKIQVGERVDVVSRDRLKPHLGSVAPKAAVPPKRGWPSTASIVSVASSPSAAKPEGPV